MPWYDFVCEHGHITPRKYGVDKLPPDTVCLTCGQTARRKINGAKFIIK